MKSLPFSKIRIHFVILTLIILAGGIGYRLGEQKFKLNLTPDKRVVVNTQPPAGLNVDFGLFWDVWQRIGRNYIDAKSIDKQKMVWGAISGMVNSLDDPYTTFLPPKENMEFKEELGGQFEGIGAQLGLREGRIIVETPLTGNPALKAGIRAGDIILKVNDEDTYGWSVPQAVSKIRGPKGTQVKLTVLHENAAKPVEIIITRATIKIASVTLWFKTPAEIKEISGLSEFSQLRRLPAKIAYLQLTRFGDNTNEEWFKAVDEIVLQPPESIGGLILDLRNNPGGYLEGSVFIASEFIKNGKIVTQTNSDGTKQDYEVKRKGKLLNIPLVVLVNKGSASAAEIVAGALRDYRRATLVGETTFGKGSVQTPEDLPGGAGLHITTGKWLLPKGDWINHTGVKPDLEVILDEATTATEDAQLARAVELLLK